MIEDDSSSDYDTSDTDTSDSDDGTEDDTEFDAISRIFAELMDDGVELA